MAELEIHHEGHESDGKGQMVGILAAVLAVALAIVSIMSHRTHTEAIITRSEANDAWSYYQAARIKAHNVELGLNLLVVLGAKGDAAEKMKADNEAQKKKYDRARPKISRRKPRAMRRLRRRPNAAACAMTWARGCSRSRW